MKLLVHSGMQLADLRAQFRAHYPYLQPDVASPDVRNVAFLPLGRLAGREFACDVDISRKQTIASVEDCFRRRCGLRLRIIRRGPHAWEEILHKESQSLEQQNLMGRAVTRGMYEPDLLL